MTDAETIDPAGVAIVYARPALLPAFCATLDLVARERMYIEMTEAPSQEQLATFQMRMLALNMPVFYALSGERVLGWADISAAGNPRLAHRGFLGMGLLPEARGLGLGQKLLEAALKHAREQTALEKVELLVFTSNIAAIGLYRKFGFEEIGVIRHFRKLDGVYFDCLEMELFLREQPTHLGVL
ncbi:MAG: GNAT family N-acetyltransferase [Candidatus Sericytochromatia bacterium]|nr:GNAT family N-acetyltransferase [Candidatus Sericytochromatia bacterium]